MDERSGQDGATTHWVGYQFPAQEPQVAVLVQSRFGLPRDTTVYDLLADEVAFFSELDGFAEVSMQEVSPGILQTHFKHFDIGTCRSGSDMFGLHIKAEPRSYTVLVDICNFKFSKFDERFVERVFDGFNYE